MTRRIPPSLSEPIDGVAVAPAVKEHKKREYVLAFAECGNRSQAAGVGGAPRGAGQRATLGAVGGFSFFEVSNFRGRGKPSAFWTAVFPVYPVTLSRAQGRVYPELESWSSNRPYQWRVPRTT
jgi:hypothetical protein